jgi:hypothetical protein
MKYKYRLALSKCLILNMVHYLTLKDHFLTKKLLFILVLFLLLQNLLLAQNNGSPTYSYELSAAYKVFDANHKKYFSRGNEVMVVKFDNFNNIMI